MDRALQDVRWDDPECVKWDHRTIVTNSNDEIWSDWYTCVCSFHMWRAHLQWLHKCGWDRAFQIARSRIILENPQHEVVEMLNQFVGVTGWGNAHFGLTSSDITDNVRLAQIARSVDRIQEGVVKFQAKLTHRFHNDAETVAYTHLMPASKTSWTYRQRSWNRPLALILAGMPIIRAKKFGGSVGHASVLRTLIPKTEDPAYAFDWSEFGLEEPTNSSPIQSSDHICEMKYAQWIAQLAAQIHKICLDLRFLISKGVVKPVYDESYVGSSSMPHKRNPFLLERACAMAKTLRVYQDVMFDVMADNALERTLNTSWAIKRALRVGTRNMLRLTELLGRIDYEIDQIIDHDTLSLWEETIGSEEDLATKVFKHAESDRWSEYCKTLESYKK